MFTNDNSARSINLNSHFVMGSIVLGKCYRLLVTFMYLYFKNTVFTQFVIYFEIPVFVFSVSLSVIKLQIKFCFYFSISSSLAHCLIFSKYWGFIFIHGGQFLWVSKDFLGSKFYFLNKYYKQMLVYIFLGM